MTKITYTRFLHYLMDELSISNDSIEQAGLYIGRDTYLLPIALWQYGLLTLKQLDQVYDWLSAAYRDQTPLMP